MRIRPIHSVVAGLIVICVLVVLAVEHVDLAESWRALLSLDARGLLAPAGIAVLLFFLRAERWRVLFPVKHRPVFRDAFAVIAVSYLLNNLLPGRGGDVARCVLISGGTNRLERSGVAFGTLVVEKVLDGLALLAIVVVSFLLFAPPTWFFHLGIVAAAVFVGSSAALAFIHYRRTQVRSLIERLFAAIRLKRIGRRLGDLMEKFAEGLEIVSSARRLTVASVFTVLIWASEAGVVITVAAAMEVNFGIGTAATLLAVIGLGMMIPTTPGYVGTYQFLTVVTLDMFGVGAETGLAVGIALHAWMYVTTTAWGGVGLIMKGIGLREISRLRPKDGGG